MSDERIVTPVGRLAFCKNLFNPNKKGRYTVAVVFDKTPDNINALEPLKKLIAETANTKWGEGKVPSDMKSPMKVEERSDMLEKYDFMKDRVTLNATNGFEIPVIDTNNQEMFDGDLKAGDEVRVSVSAYAYDAEGNRGVGFNVHGLQWVKKGEAFYQRQSAADMFGGAPKVEGEAFTGNNAEGNNQGGSFDNYGF